MNPTANKSEALALAYQYFDLSNTSDMQGIAALMSPSTTYSSANTGLYLGVSEIIAMQRAFHASFERLRWTILEAQEIRPGIIQIHFSFEGIKLNGENIKTKGLEHILVYNQKIQHIEVRNTPTAS